MKKYPHEIISKRKILLTMGMPVFNEERHITEAIESLLAQTYKNFILIVSDNGSTDRTSQMCKYYAKRDERIIYVRHKKNRGSLFNFRYLLEQTKTPFLMLCGGHDKWHPSFVEELLPALMEGDIVLSYSRSATINKAGTIGKIYRDDYTTVKMNNPVDRYLYILKEIRSCNLFYGIWSTKALKNCDFNKKVVALDLIMLTQAALEGKFKQFNKVLFFPRTSRKEKNYRYIFLRQFAKLTGRTSIEKKSVSLLLVSYILESIKIPFRKRYSFNLVTKLWLVINIISVSVFNFFVIPNLNIGLKKILPVGTYHRLKSIWKKIRHEN